jgi:hypothetical protein
VVWAVALTFFNGIDFGVNITPVVPFSGVLLVAASMPWAVETIGSSTKSYSMMRVLAAGGTSGWLGVFALIAAACGIILPILKHSPKIRRRADISMATTGAALHYGFAAPILSGRFPFADWGPGIGFFGIMVCYLAAGLLALRGTKEESRP